MSPQSIQFADRPESNLIVTDSRPLAIALVQALANLGQSSPEDRVVSVEDAAQACQSNRDVVQRFLVALGDDATRGLKAVQQLREVCSVPLFVVGMRDAELILDAIRACATGILTKPVDFEDLLTRIRSAITLKRCYEELNDKKAERKERFATRMGQLQRSQLEIVSRLRKSAEYRNSPTGRNDIRPEHYSRQIALETQLSAAEQT